MQNETDATEQTSFVGAEEEFQISQVDQLYFSYLQEREARLQAELEALRLRKQVLEAEMTQKYTENGKYRFTGPVSLASGKGTRQALQAPNEMS